MQNIKGNGGHGGAGKAVYNLEFHFKPNAYDILSLMHMNELSC